MHSTNNAQTSEARAHELWARTLFIVRWMLPGILTGAGATVIIVEPHGATLHGGLGVVGAGLAAFLFAFLARLSMSGDEWRLEEEDARRFFDANGYWPDEDASAARRMNPSRL